MTQHNVLKAGDYDTYLPDDTTDIMEGRTPAQLISDTLSNTAFVVVEASKLTLKGLASLTHKRTR